MSTYEKLDTILHLKQRADERELASRKVGNHTYLQRRADGDIAVKLHATDVATFHADDTVTLNSGGWRTVTTKARINDALPAPFVLHSVKGIWYVHVGSWADPIASIPYADGLRLSLSTPGKVLNPEVLPDVPRITKVNDKLKRDIKAYVALYTDERIAELVKSAQEQGTGGDCWFCGLFGGDNDHRRSHLAEGYTMFSVMWNAVKTKGYRVPEYIVQYAPDLVRRAISVYLRKALLEGQVTR